LPSIFNASTLLLMDYTFTRPIADVSDCRIFSTSSSLETTRDYRGRWAAAIFSTYYPSQYRTWTKAGQRWLTNVVLDNANFAVKEFWPDIHRTFIGVGVLVGEVNLALVTAPPQDSQIKAVPFAPAQLYAALPKTHPAAFGADLSIA
jgi:hypothetical protein